VATEPKNLHMCIDADARLAAAAGGVARFLADAAGLEGEAVARLQSAVIEACVEAFEHLAGNHPHLEIDFARLSDRLEVSLSHEDTGPAIGMHTITGFASKQVDGTENSGALAGVDRVQHETHGKEIVTRLTKYLGQVAPSL
jgi:anti-sigma regulatory factor (Ser/Thr protein kinase)